LQSYISLLKSEVLSHDALRMRLRRLVEIKQSGKCHVPQEVVDDFKTGGELKEWLEIALLESIKKVGTDRCKFKAVKVGVWEFLVRFNYDMYVLFLYKSPHRDRSMYLLLIRRSSKSAAKL